MIKLFKPILNQEAINEELPKVFASGMIGCGQKTDEFCEELKKKLGRKEVITTNSCTSALHQALSIVKRAIGGLGGQHRVLCSSLTCFAATSAIYREEFWPTWVDIDRNTFCMSLDEVEEELGYEEVDQEIRCIMWTSWGGVAPDYKRMIDITQRYSYKGKLYWILDLAHAFGTLAGGSPIPANLVDNFFHCYSFGPIKTLTCGEGGALVTPPEFYDIAERMNWYGISRKDKCSFRAWSDIKMGEVGSKWNLNDINATVGLCNLRTVGYAIQNSNDNIQYYLRNIKNDHISLLPAKTFQGTSGWLFTIVVPDRDHFVNYMAGNGIEANGVHRPNHELSCMVHFRYPLPILDSLREKYVCIPCGPWLKQNDIEYITEKVNAYKAN